MFSSISFGIIFICTMHMTLSSNNVVELSLIDESPHDSWIC